MTLVIDSCVAVKWFAPEADHAAALALLDGDEELLAPDLLLAEVGNALCRKVRNSEISAEQADAALAELGSLVRLLPLTLDVVREAASIAIDLQHPVYDCIFLACAIRHSVPLVTADKKFLAKLSGRPDLQSVRGLAPKARD